MALSVPKAQHVTIDSRAEYIYQPVRDCDEGHTTIGASIVSWSSLLLRSLQMFATLLLSAPG